MSKSITELRANAHLPAKDYGRNNLAQFFAANREQIQKVIPHHLNADRMLKVAYNAIMTTPQLAECTVESLMGAVIQSSILGLEPNTPMGHAYLVPFFNGKKKVKEVQFVLGYKGLIDLARRSGQIESINAHEVYSNDEFAFEYGLDEKLVHKPSWQADRGQMVGVYAVAKFKDGGYVFEVMSRSQVEKIRDGSAGYKFAKASNFSSPWDSSFDEMSRKTVIRRLAKYLPMSIELQTANQMDRVAELAQPQGLDQVLTGEYTVSAEEPTVDEPASFAMQIQQRGYYEDAEGHLIAADGEVWDATVHALNKDGHPVPMVGGGFRKKRSAIAGKAIAQKTPGEEGHGAGDVPAPTPGAQGTPQGSDGEEEQGEEEDPSQQKMGLD